MLLGKDIPKLVTEESHSARVNPERESQNMLKANQQNKIFSVFSFCKLLMYTFTSYPRVTYSSTLALYNDTAAKNWLQMEVSLTLVEHTIVWSFWQALDCRSLVSSLSSLLLITLCLWLPVSFSDLSKLCLWGYGYFLWAGVIAASWTSCLSKNY